MSKPRARTQTRFSTAPHARQPWVPPLRTGRLLALLAGAIAPVAAAGGEHALRDLLALAPQEQVVWGQRFEHGESVPRDAAAAVRLYCAAARAGSAEAAYRLGWMYMNGRGVARDDELAGAWLQRAARAGHEYARRALDHVGPPDPSRAAMCIAPLDRARIDVAPRMRGFVPVVNAAGGVRDDEGVLAGDATEEPSDAISAQIERTVRAWAAAWSRGDVERYLDFYSPRFRPASDTTRAEWASLRRNRLSVPAFIDVELDRLRVTPVEPGSWQARFLQRYRSDRFADLVEKELVLTQEDGAWKIEREHVLATVAER